MNQFLILLAMSLFSILFGCNTKKTPDTIQAWPRFPETDNPAAKVTLVNLDDDFWLRSFFIPQDKQHVYVLGSRISRSRRTNSPDDPSQARLMDYRLYCLDRDGQIKHHIDLFRIDAIWGVSIGQIGDEMLIRIGDYFMILDPQKFVIHEKIPVYDTPFFPSKQKVELMTPDEQRDAYQLLFDAQLKKGSACKWLDWTPGGQYFVMVQDHGGKRAAWSPMSYEDTLIAELKGRMEPLPVTLNPNANPPRDGSELQITDGAAHLKIETYLSGGTELVYPNYKNRKIAQYEMLLGAKKIHFSTTDKKAHDLRLSLSDNLMLTTDDGRVWVGYDGVLYRVE